MGALVDAIDRMEREVAAAIPLAMMDAGQLIVEGAKTGHPWRNRTGRLERSIRTTSVRGSIRAGFTLRVVGATPYGSFLEEGWEVKRGDWHRDDSGNEVHMGTVSAGVSQWAFLLPAYERVDDQFARIVEEAMAAALR